MSRSGRYFLVLLLAAATFGGGLYLGRVMHRAPVAAEQPEEQIYTCPMHPQIRHKGPGTCPICGMDLVPLKSSPAGEKEQPSGLPGQAAVTIDPKQQQLIGVVTTPVRKQHLDRLVRTVGQVTLDESRTYEVHTKIDGWVEKLYANETGKVVSKGQPLLTVYSPDLVSTQQEYLVALRSRQRLANSPFAEVKKSGETLVAATRERLRLWDISEADIKRLETTGHVRRTLAVNSPASGFILEKQAIEGMKVDPAMALLKLVDLSRVWVDVSVYEFEAPLIKTGLRAKLTLQAQPGAALWGKVTYVYPTVDATTRTLKARLEFANPGLRLKPGMYADVELLVPSEDQLSVPEQAVLDTGTRTLVFVKQGEGTFLPREVTLGPRAGGAYPVLSGLKEGEEIVSSPNFLLDSESKLRAMSEDTAAVPAKPAPKTSQERGG
jgi:membrane fusion protein, copper/silver efflux system